LPFSRRAPPEPRRTPPPTPPRTPLPPASPPPRRAGSSPPPPSAPPPAGDSAASGLPFRSERQIGVTPATSWLGLSLLGLPCGRLGTRPHDLILRTIGSLATDSLATPAPASSGDATAEDAAPWLRRMVRRCIGAWWTGRAVKTSSLWSGRSDHHRYILSVIHHHETLERG
jgi:hypothetical protein